MIIKITLIILGVSALFQIYFWCDDPRVDHNPPEIKETNTPKPIHLVPDTPPSLIPLEPEKPFITHLVKVDNELVFTEWEVININ